MSVQMCLLQAHLSFINISVPLLHIYGSLSAFTDQASFKVRKCQSNVMKNISVHLLKTVKVNFHAVYVDL